MLQVLGVCKQLYSEQLRQAQAQYSGDARPSTGGRYTLTQVEHDPHTTHKIAQLVKPGGRMVQNSPQSPVPVNNTNSQACGGKGQHSTTTACFAQLRQAWAL